MNKYAKAILSITKTSLGISRVSPEEYHKRLAACAICPASVSRDNCPKCSACGCLIEAKALDKKEQCPIGRPEWRVDNATDAKV
jgi:hypothetical protein